MDYAGLDRITDRAANRRFSRRQALIQAGSGMTAISLAAGGLAHAAAGDATPADEGGPMGDDVLGALQASRAWINYGPGRPFDFEHGNHPLGEAQLRQELELLYAQGFRGIVTNAMTYGLEATPRVARQVGFHHVIAKLWWADDEALAIEKRNLEDAIDDVDAIVVGNETVNKAIHRGEPGDDAVERLRTEIEGLQLAYGKPVTTGLHRDDWVLYPQIATGFGDFVFANLQPWWGLLRNDPELAARWVADAFELIRATPDMPGDRVIVLQEAAFPSHAEPPASAPGATRSNQTIFFQRLIESGVPFVYGFSCDQWYAREYSPPGGYGGLWDDRFQPKPVVEALDLGPYA